MLAIIYDRCDKALSGLDKGRSYGKVTSDFQQCHRSGSETRAVKNPWPCTSGQVITVLITVGPMENKYLTVSNATDLTV